MAGEQAVRDALLVDEGDTVVELGVFPPPPGEFANSEAAEGTGEEHSTSMSGDMLALLGLTEHWSTAQHIQPSLPAGRALRHDVDPRIVLLEDIPEPLAVVGGVVKRGPRQWIMDTRSAEPAVIVVPHHDHERLIIWGANEVIRLFSWQAGRA